MSNSNQGITFGNKIVMIEDAVIQQQSFISRILQSIQTLLQNNESNQSNENLTTQFNEIINDFQQQQKNFDFNTTQDLQLFSKIDLNNEMVNEHQVKLEDTDSELKTIKFLLNNLKDGAPSEDDFEEYKNKIAEIEENRTKNQMDPILKSLKCIKYEMKKMKENNSNAQPHTEDTEPSNDYANLNHELKCMKYELKKLKNKIGNNDNIERNVDNQPTLQSNDQVVAKIYSDLYKVRDDLKEDINSLQEEAAPLLNEETRKFPGKLKTFKRELKQLKKIQEDLEKTNSDLLERQEKIFLKLKQLRDEKINPLDAKVDKLQSSFDSWSENNNEDERRDILSKQEELKEKIDELTAQINLLDKQKIEPKGLDQARDDLQNLKDAINVEIPENLSNSEEEDSEISSSNMLDNLRSLKLQIKDLSIQNKRQDQSINQLLDNSNSINNTFYENVDSRIQAIEKQLADFNSLASNAIQNATPINEMRKSIGCLKFEVKRLKTAMDQIKDTNATLIKDRAVELTNNNNDSNSRRLDELESEVQNLNDLNDRVKELTSSVNIIKEQQTNPVESFDSSAIKRDVQCLKYEIKRLKNKQSQRNEDEFDIPNSKIDAIESNISDIKQELQTTIQDELNQYNGKLQSLENTILSLINQINNEKEKVTTRNVTNQNSEIWPLVQIPAEKHEVNPLIGVIREKIHSLVDEMDQAPEQSEDVNKMKPSMNETQDHLKKLQETLNQLLIQDEFQTVKLTPQMLWDRVCALENRKHRTHIKDRDITIGEEEDLDYDHEIRNLKYSVKCLKYEMKKFKANEAISSASEQLNSIAQKVSELYGSQHQAIKVINSQSSQIQQHHTTINDQLGRIEDLESSIKNLEGNGQNLDEIEQLTNELEELKNKLLSIEDDNDKFKGQINQLEDNSYAFLGPTTTSKKDPNPIVLMLEAQVTELLQQIEDPTLKEEPDETGELHPTMDQAEQDLITVQKELRDLLEQEQADAKHEAARAFNLVQKHTQNRINHLEKIIRKQNETYKAVQEFYHDIEGIKFRLNELSNSQQQVIRNMNMQNDQIDSTKSVLSRDVIPQLNDIHSQFDEHLDEHALLSTQVPSTAKDSVIKHTPNPVVESLREQINNLLVQMENPDVKETCENEKNENLKPSMEQLQRNLTVLQDTLQKILNSQIYIPAEETLRGFQDQIYLLQDKYVKQTREINELKKSGNDQLESRINDLEETISDLKKQNLESINKQIYGEEISKESDRITALEKELQNLKDIIGKNKIVSRGEIEQPIMKTDSEGHFIIRKTKRLNGTANRNVQKLKRQIDELTEKIRKAELDEEEDDEIDGELHDHLGKTSDDLIILRAQLQRILEGYEVDEIVPISPQEMFDQLVNLQRRVDQLEGKPPSEIKSRGVNLQPNGDENCSIQQILASYNKCAQQLNAQTSYLHQFKEILDELNDRVSDNESSLDQLREQLQDGAAFDELRSVQEELQMLKDQLEIDDDYDVIEIEGGDADVEIELEEDKNDNNNHQTRSNSLPSRIRQLEKKVADLEKGSPNIQLREILTSDGLPYSEAGFNEAANSSLYKSNPQIKAIQDQIDLLMKELNNSEFDSDEDDQTHVKTNVEDTKKQLKVLQDALEELIREDQQERIRLATLSPQKLLYKLDELNAKINELPQDLAESVDYLKSEVEKINEKLNDNTNQLQDHTDDFSTLTNRINGIIGSQNLLIQNTNAQNQKIKVLTELVEDEEQKNRIDDIEEEFRNHISNHDELISNLPNNKSKVKTRSAKLSREHSQKEINPYIKGIQGQIDALINNMNDLNQQQKQDEKEDKELDSRITETETELLLLQKTLGTLQNFDDYEIQEEEEEDFDEPVSHKVIKKLQYSVGCLKYEVKKLKHNQKELQENPVIQTRGISLDEQSELTSKVEDLENKLNKISKLVQNTSNEHKINHLEGEINDLNKQLQEQPEQILSSLKLLWSKSPKGTSKYTNKKKAVNPVIQDIQDQIDVLVSKMNDPSMMDQDQDDEELAPQIKQTQDELAILQETLKTLMEGIDEEEEEDSENYDALYISPALVLSRLIKIEKEFMKNSEVKHAIHCLKHEVKHVKCQDSYLQTLKERTEELTQSQNSVINAVNGFKSYLTHHKDQEIKGQILELEERVSLLENQPPFPVIAPTSSGQMSLNSQTSLPISSSSRMIREIHKPRNVSPIIKEIQDQIDALVRKMNDPSIKKQKEKGTLNPSFAKTQAQLAKLRATLKRLQEMEDVEIIEDDINRAEDDEFFNVQGNYLSKQLLVENISYLHHKVNSEIIPSLRCIKHELRHIKQNGVSIKSRGIILDPQEEEETNEKLKEIANNYDNLMNRIDEITASQSQVISTINQHKRMIDETNEKLDSVNDTIEDHLENGEEKNLYQRIENIEQNVDDLQANGFGQTVISKSKTKEVNPIIQLLKDRIDELVEQMNDPELQNNDEQTNNELNPSLNKAENEVLVLREQLRKLLEEEDEPDIIVTPESLYQMIQENKNKLSQIESDNDQQRSETIQNLEKEIEQLKNKLRDSDINNRLQDIEERVDNLTKRTEEYANSHCKLIQNNNANKTIVDKINDKLNEQQKTITDNYEDLETRIASLEESQNNSPFASWGKTVTRSIGKETDLDEDDQEEEPITIETLPDIISNLRSRSVNLDQSNGELRRMVQCLKYEVKKLKSKNQQSSDRPQMTEEELMAYCDRLEQIAQRYDKHIVEAKNEMKRYREIKSQMKKDNEVTNSLQRDIKCLKYEVKNLKLKRSGRSGNNLRKDNLNDDNGLDGFDNDDDNDNGGGPNKRTRSSTKSSQQGKNGGSSKGKNGSGKSTHQNKNLEERVDIIEDSQEKTIQNVNSQHSYLNEVNKIIQQFSYQLNDHDKRIEELEQSNINNDNNVDNQNVTKRSLPFDYIDSDQPEDDLDQLKKRLNELTASQQSIISGFNSQNQSIQQIKDQIEDLLSKHEDEIQNIQNRDVVLPSTDEEAQESIKRIEEDLNEIKENLNQVMSSQKIVVSNNNSQTENIRSVIERLNEIELYQKQQQEEQERQEENNNAIEFDEDKLNSIRCLKYEMKRLKDKVKDLSLKQQEQDKKEEEKANNKVIDFDEDTLNSIKCLKYEMKRLKNKVKDLSLKQEEQEEINIQNRSAILSPEENEESQRNLNCIKYETKKLKENVHFIDERINQITNSQKLITDNVNSQTSHIREIKEKLNEIDAKQQEQEEENQPIVQTRDISLLSSDLENRIDEISASHSTLVKTLNAQRSQIDQIKEKLDETMTNQMQIMENTDNLMSLQNDTKQEEPLYQPSSEQILRIEKELTELQKNHLHLKSQFYDHVNENNNNKKIDISQPLLDSMNQIRESQNKVIQTTNAQSSLIREINNKVSAHEASISELFNDTEKIKDNEGIQDQLNSLEERVNQLISQSYQELEDRVNQIISSQNRAIQTINSQTTNLRKHENEINMMKKEIETIQKESNSNIEEEIELIKQDIDNLKDEIYQKEINQNEQIEELKEQILNNEQIESFNKSIKCIKYELKKLINNQESNNNSRSIIEGDIKRIKSKIVKIEQFNDQVAPHINKIEENYQKQKEKITKLIQFVDKMKQDIKQLNDIFNISPFLITTGDEQRKTNLKTFFESVAKIINDHSATLVKLEQRISNQENQSSFIQQQPLSPKSKQNQKIRDENIANFVSTAEFQKYTTNNNLQIEQLMKKVSSNNKSSTSSSSNNDQHQISLIKREIESLKIPEIKKDIDTIKSNLRNSTINNKNYDDGQNQDQKVDLLLSRIDKLEEQLANKTAEIESRNNEIEDIKNYSHKLAKHIKAQEEKIRVIRETINIK